MVKPIALSIVMGTTSGEPRVKGSEARQRLEDSESRYLCFSTQVQTRFFGGHCLLIKSTKWNRSFVRHICHYCLHGYKTASQVVLARHGHVQSLHETTARPRPIAPECAVPHYSEAAYNSNQPECLILQQQQQVHAHHRWTHAPRFMLLDPLNLALPSGVCRR
jgi:hypothetical protein